MHAWSIHPTCNNLAPFLKHFYWGLLFSGFLDRWAHLGPMWHISGRFVPGTATLAPAWSLLEPLPITLAHFWPFLPIFWLCTPIYGYFGPFRYYFGHPRHSASQSGGRSAHLGRSEGWKRPRLGEWGVQCGKTSLAIAI